MKIRGLARVAEQHMVMLKDGRLRSISTQVVSGQLNIPELPEEKAVALLSDEVEYECWSEGDILTSRWPVPEFVEPAVSAFLAEQGFEALKDDEPMLYGACGATFHHDAEYFGQEMLVMAWLEGDEKWDLYFPVSGQRIPLGQGTIAVFDPGNIHGVVQRGATRFNDESFYQDGFQLFAHFHLGIGPAVQARMGFEVYSEEHTRSLIEQGISPLTVDHYDGHTRGDEYWSRVLASAKAYLPDLRI